VLVTGLPDKTLRFFAIDGMKNPKVASVHFDDLPIASAGWTCDGAEVIITGCRSFFYSYDVESGPARAENTPRYWHRRPLPRVVPRLAALACSEPRGGSWPSSALGATSPSSRPLAPSSAFGRCEDGIGVRARGRVVAAPPATLPPPRSPADRQGHPSRSS